MRKIYVFLIAIIMATSLTRAAGPEYASDFNLTGATGAVSSAYKYAGAQSYLMTGGGIENPQLSIGVNTITNWTSITKVTMWVYSTSNWNNGQLFVNSGDPGWVSANFNIDAANTWQQLSFDFSAKPYNAAATWGQFGMQYYNKSGVLYIDEVTFYDATGAVVYKVDAGDAATPPTAMSLTPTTQSLIVGKNYSLVPAFTPTDAGKSVTYTSSDPSTTVSSTGVVTAVSVGSATITATSVLATSISANASVLVSAPDVSQSLVYDNFENGLGNYESAWPSWNTTTGASGAAPIVDIVSNPSGTGKALKISTCYQYGAIAFKAFDLNVINKIKFKVYSETAISDMRFELGLSNGTSSTVNTNATALPAGTWTEYTYDVSFLQSTDKAFYIKLSSSGSAEATNASGYTFYIDDITYIAGDASAFKPVTGLLINDATISTDNGSIQLEGTFSPSDATNTKIASWSLVNQNKDTATISATGLLTAVRNAKVKVKAISADGDFIAEKVISITGQKVPVDSLKLRPSGAFPAAISNNGGKLRIDTIAKIYPVDATNSKISWTLKNDNINKISKTGELTACKNGEVWVIATSDSSALATDSIKITITNQVIATGITVTGANSATSITTNGGTLQMSAAILPVDAASKDVEWSIVSGTATISADGVLSPAGANGIVTVKASALDGSAVFGTLDITISGQVAITGITVTGAAGATTISSNTARTLQMSAEVLPVEVSDKSVVWSISSNDADTATISATGLLTAIRNGKVTVKATSSDGVHSGELVITISGIIVPVSSVAISNTESAISTNNGTLQLTATILPADAANKNVTWSISSSDADTASISATGLLTAIRNGKVTVKATAADGSGLFAEKVITLTKQIVEVTGLTLQGSNITTNGGTSTITATTTPTDATEKGVTWKVSDETIATINTTGVLTAKKNGTVTVTATSKESGSTISATKSITISGQIVKVTSVTVTGAANATTITTKNGTLQMAADVLSAEATDKTVTWTVTNGTGEATISATGLLTAVKNGKVTVTATANDGSTKAGSIEITISGQITTAISINESTEVCLYPNPAVDVIAISGNSIFNSVEIMSIDGKLISKSLNVAPNSKINVSNLKEGVYLVRLTTNNISTTKRFVKK